MRNKQFEIHYTASFLWGTEIKLVLAHDLDDAIEQSRELEAMGFEVTRIKPVVTA